MSSIFPIINSNIDELNNLFNPSKQNLKPKIIFGDIKNLLEIHINKEELYKPTKNNGVTHFNNKHLEIENKILNEENKISLKSQKPNNLNNESKLSKKEEIENNKESKNEEIITTTKPIEKKYKFYIKTTKDNFIKIPNPNYGTDDKDLKYLIELMNEKPLKENGYHRVVEEANIHIFKRMVPGIDVILIKSICTIPYNKDIIFEAIANVEIRKKWDSVFSELKVVNHNGENGAEILYMIIKSPSFLVSDRDFVQQRKIWKEFPTKNSHILHFISVESPDCPLNKKYVRAETIISGYFIEDIPNQPNKSTLGIISQTDIRGKIPTWLVNKVAPKASKGWVVSLLKGCKMVLGEI